MHSAKLVGDENNDDNDDNNNKFGCYLFISISVSSVVLHCFFTVFCYAYLLR